MVRGKLPELDVQTAQQYSTVAAKSLIVKALPFAHKDQDMIGWQQDARKAAEEARRRKYFLAGKTKPQREARKALEKMLKKSKNPGADKLMQGFSVVKPLKSMTTKGQGWHRIKNQTTGRTGSITQGVNAKGQKFATKIQQTQRFKKGGKAFDRYVVERVVNGKKVTETHDFDITGSGLFTHGFEGCVREAQSKGYVPNSEQAEKLCGWILQEAGVNVARQGLATMMGREEMVQYGGNAPVIKRGKGGKSPMHLKQYGSKVLPHVQQAGKKYMSSGPGGYSQKQFGGRVGLPAKGKK